MRIKCYTQNLKGFFVYVEITYSFVYFFQKIYSLFVVCLNSKHGYSLCMLILKLIYGTCRGESGKQLVKICANHMDFCCTNPELFF